MLSAVETGHHMSVGSDELQSSKDYSPMFS